MRRSVLAGTIASFLLPPAALRADILQQFDPATIKGNVQEFMLRVDALPRSYPRADIWAVELASGNKLSGKVVSLTGPSAGRWAPRGYKQIIPASHSFHTEEDLERK